MRDEIQVTMSMKVNLISEDADGQMGAVDYGFGVNKVPTKKEMDEAIKGAIAMFNEQLGVTDSRLVQLEDFGIASPKNMLWEFDQ